MEPFERAMPDGTPGETYLNDRYQVTVHRDHQTPPGWPAVTYLSIKRRDKEPIHDWRDLQLIKNALCGPEREAVELYPAESRLVDEANQYHLWVLAEGMHFPFGFGERRVGTPEEAAAVGAKQRPFEHPPAPPSRQVRRRQMRADAKQRRRFGLS